MDKQMETGFATVTNQKQRMQMKLVVYHLLNKDYNNNHQLKSVVLSGSFMDLAV